MANMTQPNPPVTPVKQLNFAFPFRKKGQGNAGASADFTDEHDFYKVLQQEPSGSYSVSGKGMWHGGIHVTEAGAGDSLDLKNGARCMVNGEVVAWRLNRTYPISEIPAQNGKPAISAPYSAGFALVRHSMEFPKGSTLKFFSLYMHLQDLAGYEMCESDTSLSKPAYWSTRFQITEFAKDKPDAGPNGQVASPDQQGLRVRATKVHGTILGILPHGAQVSIGKREGDWGQIKDTHDAPLIAPQAGGFVAQTAAVNGWIFLGKEHGGPLVEEIMPDAFLDCVVVPSVPFPIKAGDLIGHLGRYDSLNQQTANRMVHIEVFCDDSVKSFLEQGRTWISHNGAHPDAWQQLGLQSDPTILRVDKNTTLYRAVNQPGQDAQRTDVIQVAALAEMARHSENRYTETTAGTDDLKLHWWKVDSADVHRHAISGWVREQNFAGGRVTREFAQKWVDFQTLEDTHDPTHTMFATTKAFVDYTIGADVPEAGALGKLSPLMASIYRALYATGDGSRAADELCAAAQDPWTAMRMSRLIIRHESEWANPAKWKQLVAEIEKQTGPQAQHEAELKRIEKLAWWDEVKAGLADLPAPDVFHIHPIGLVGNFVAECVCKVRFLKISKIVLINEGGYVNDPSDSGGATNKGIAWNTWQAYAKEDLEVEPTLENLRALTDDQAKIIYLKRYWEPRGFCEVENEKTALNIYDWTITSEQAVKKIQEILTSEFSKVIAHDNKISKIFFDHINSITDQEDLVQKIGDSRKKYYASIARHSDGTPNKNHKFLLGWLARVNRCLDYKG